MSNLPKPPGVESGELTLNESTFILDTTLHPKNRNSPVVLAFIDSFIRCKNIAQASSECAIKKSVGYAIRHRKDVSNCIQKLIDKSTIKHGFDASEIIERVKEVVDFDPIDMMNPDGSFKSNMHDIAPEARRNIKKLKVKNLYRLSEDINGIKTKIIEGEVIEYEFYDKLKASELVGKEKELFKNVTKVEHAITKDMAEILLESSRRADKYFDKKPEPITIEAEVINQGSEGEQEGRDN